LIGISREFVGGQLLSATVASRSRDNVEVATAMVPAEREVAVVITDQAQVAVPCEVRFGRVFEECGERINLLRVQQHFGVGVERVAHHRHGQTLSRARPHGLKVLTTVVVETNAQAVGVPSDI
jgi:hypothetical protein